MGILFSCFRWSTTDEEEDEVPNSGDNQLGRGAIRPKDKKESINHLQKGHAPELKSEHEPRPTSEHEPRPTSEPKPRSEPEPMHESEPEPELERVIEISNGSITRKSNLHEDSISSGDEECPICLEGYTSENPRIVTTCLHHFHLGCIYDWQERSGLCPSCLKVMEFQEMN